MIKSESVSSVLAALGQAQDEFPSVPKRSENPYFSSKFADLGTIKEFVDPILQKHGLHITQQASHIGERPALETLLFHESGEYIGNVTPLSLAKTDPQSQGSAISYMRRYSYSALLNLVSEDDDGNRASHANPKELQEAHGRVKEAAQRSNTTKAEVEKLFYGKYKTKLADTVDVSALNALADHLTEKAVQKEMV